MARIRTLLLTLFLLAGLSLSAMEIRSPKGRVVLPEQSWGGASWVCANDLAKAFDGSFGKDDVSTYPLLVLSGHRILFSTHSALASVDGKVVKFQRPPVDRDGCLWLSSDCIEAVLSASLGGQVTVSASAPGPAPPAVNGAQGEGTVSLELTGVAEGARLTLTGASAETAAISREDHLLKVVLGPSGRFAPPGPVAPGGLVQAMEIAGGGRILSVRVGPGFRDWESLKLKNPSRLVVLMKGTGEAVPPAAPGAFIPPASPPVVQTPEVPAAAPPPPKTAAFDLVVVDPGHGGGDTGAIGPGGIMEKDVALILAKKLKTALEARGIRVILTRDADTSISLVQRTAVANVNHADVFLSIHLNASPAASARGAETYYMSREASDLWSKELALKENAEPGAVSRGSSDLDLVLWDLAQTAAIVESAVLAESIQDEFNALLQTSDRGVRQAPFVVLEGAQMPAVLVEVAFLSNPGEAKKLMDPAFQDQAVEALVRAVLLFKARYENPNAVPQP